MKSRPQPIRDRKIWIGYFGFTVEITLGTTLCFFYYDCGKLRSC